MSSDEQMKQNLVSREWFIYLPRIPFRDGPRRGLTLSLLRHTHTKHVYKFSYICGLDVLRFISEPINLKFLTSRKVLVGEREREKTFLGAVGMKI